MGPKSSLTLVSLTLAGREVPVPVGLRLFLPEEWTADPERGAAAGVPDDEVVARTKGEIAGRVGPAHRRWRAVRHHPGRCRLRGECCLPPRVERAGPDLGGGYPAHPKSL